VRYLGKAAWDEIILLSLYLFEKSTGPSFIDAFCEQVFEKLSLDHDPDGWFLMGRAARDNISFAREDIIRITGEIVKIWLKEIEKDTAVSILKEITRFSKDGKNVLKDVIYEIIANNTAERAFEALYLYKQLYEINESILDIISNNKDYLNFLAYLPVYRDNEMLAGYIEKNLEEKQWVIYHNSAADKTNDIFKKLLTGKLNPFELKGFTISTWSKIFIAFQNRNRFLEINKSQLEKGNIKFLDRFFDYLFGYLFYEKFELSFNFFGSVVHSLSGKGIVEGAGNMNSFSVANPFMIPFTFNFVLTAALCHYFIIMFADLNRKFHKKKGLKEEEIIVAAVEYNKKNLFDFYFITFSWDFYSKAFNERYQQLKDGEEKSSTLAAFVVNAARM
jgi:hypothetical protein